MSLNLRVVSIAVSVCLGMLGAIQLAAPESLGISAVAARWLGIIATGLGILAGFLPRVQGPTTDPDALADRIWSLPPDQRESVAADLSARISLQQRIEQARLTDPTVLLDEEIVRSSKGRG